MGRFVILPRHPSNDFFLRFPNCLPYETTEECVDRLRWAMVRDPIPLTPELRREFTWEAATERLIRACAVSRGEAEQRERDGSVRADERVAWLHSEGGRGTGHVMGLLLNGGGYGGREEFSTAAASADEGRRGWNTDQDDVKPGAPRIAMV